MIPIWPEHFYFQPWVNWSREHYLLQVENTKTILSFDSPVPTYVPKGKQQLAYDHACQHSFWPVVDDHSLIQNTWEWLNTSHKKCDSTGCGFYAFLNPNESINSEPLLKGTFPGRYVCFPALSFNILYWSYWLAIEPQILWINNIKLLFINMCCVPIWSISITLEFAFLQCHRPTQSPGVLSKAARSCLRSRGFRSWDIHGKVPHNLKGSRHKQAQGGIWNKIALFRIWWGPVSPFRGSTNQATLYILMLEHHRIP